jgi:signal transduction histidine kinase
MPQIEPATELGPEEQKRVNQVVETLTTLGNSGREVAELAHDARNMVTALDLYCDLLQQPGVLAQPFAHYGGELRLVAAASRRLVDKLGGLAPAESPKKVPSPANSEEFLARVHSKAQPPREWKSLPPEPINDLAQQILISRNLLASLTGPTIALTINVQGAALPVRMTAEDLTRILVNLVKNSAEAMAGVGRIHISLWESCGDSMNNPWVTINVEDNGPGLPDKVLEKIFEPQPASKGADPLSKGDWPVPHHGLGLSITRSIVEAAGGFIHAANRDPAGACFQIELPVMR